ncbi:hypothetical protein [Phycicoccus duodecadis]|uniref:Uncharacterized protein n=1 Tax=Phycicoccus duodecadis TaxID=173053 RepID=A0A2N3YN82_9MICO|nr:hypothetical protein [Phycicoccus duodecadis]PKW28279.1 hypothetical protein ATL31_3142 [Phycicoccus duodecadis]
MQQLADDANRNPLPDPEPTLEGPKPAQSITLEMKTEEGYTGTAQIDLYDATTAKMSDFAGCDTTSLLAELPDPDNVWVQAYLITTKTADTSPAGFPWTGNELWLDNSRFNYDNLAWTYCQQGSDLKGSGDLKPMTTPIGESRTFYAIRWSQATPKNPKGIFPAAPVVLLPYGGVDEWVTSCKAKSDDSIPCHLEFN